MRPVFESDVCDQSSESDDDSNHFFEVDPMLKHDEGSDDGKQLPGDHDAGESYSPEPRDRQVDGDIAEGRRDTQQCDVNGQLGSGEDVGHGGDQVRLVHEGGKGQDGGVDVDEEHHLQEVDVILSAHPLLPVGSECIKSYKHEEDDQSVRQVRPSFTCCNLFNLDIRCGIGVIAGMYASRGSFDFLITHQEDQESAADGRCNQVVPDLVLLPRDYNRHDHDGQQFA